MGETIVVTLPVPTKIWTCNLASYSKTPSTRLRYDILMKPHTFGEVLYALPLRRFSVALSDPMSSFQLILVHASPLETIFEFVPFFIDIRPRDLLQTPKTRIWQKLLSQLIKDGSMRLRRRHKGLGSIHSK